MRTMTGAEVTTERIDQALNAGICATDIGAVLGIDYRSIPWLGHIDEREAITSDWLVEYHRAGTLFGLDADGNLNHNRAGWFVASALQHPRPVPKNVLDAVAQLQQAMAPANDDDWHF